MIFKNSKIYDALKYVAMIGLPALAVFWASLSKIWGWPLQTEITATICAVDVFLGALLQISSNKFNQLQQPPDNIPEDV